MMLAPVSRIFSTTTCPIVTGALTFIFFKTSIQSKILSLGKALSLLTETTGNWAPSILIVVVKILLGFRNSSVTYGIPRLHSLPSIFSMVSPVAVTVISHPSGHIIHVKVFCSSFSPPPHGLLVHHLTFLLHLHLFSFFPFHRD